MQTQKNLYSDRRAKGYFGYTTTPRSMLPWPMPSRRTRGFYNSDEQYNQDNYQFSVNYVGK